MAKQPTLNDIQKRISKLTADRDKKEAELKQIKDELKFYQDKEKTLLSIEKQMAELLNSEYKKPDNNE